MVTPHNHKVENTGANHVHVHDNSAATQDAEKRMGSVATFRMLCQGRDGKLCLFEDAKGHLTAVRTDRLA